MPLLLFVVFVVVPIAELYVIVQVAGLIGVFETIFLLVAVAILGSWLLKRQGTAAWVRFRRALANGRVPAEEISDGAMIMFGGALLLTPGFISDVLGLLLLIPPTRAALKAASRKTLRRWLLKRTGTTGVYDARVVRVERDATTSRPPGDSAPSDTRPAVLEDDSPDRG